MDFRSLLVFYLVAEATFFLAEGSVEGLYCGRENCYDILEVNRESTKSEITKAYRKLAKKWHPDMHKADKKEEASAMFLKIANAYEILTEDDSRTDYDYMLDHPDEFYYNYYRYYKTRTAPKVDVRIVIAVAISVISVVQYYGAWNNYQTAINYLCKEAKYRLSATERAKQQGLLPVSKRKDDGRRSKKEIKDEEEAIIKKIIEENMDIRGGYRKPTVKDVLWIQLVLLPYNLVMYINWWIQWTWRFTIRREEYDVEAKLYIIRKYLKLSSSQFEAIDDHEKQNYLHEQLWIHERFLAWKAKKEEEQKIELAQSGQYKIYRRYLKKGGPGQMTFGPE